MNEYHYLLRWGNLECYVPGRFVTWFVDYTLSICYIVYLQNYDTINFMECERVGLILSLIVSITAALSIFGLGDTNSETETNVPC